MASRRNEERKQVLKAAQLHDGATTLQIDDVSLPEPGPGEVRVALTRAFVAPYQRSLIDGTAGFDTPPGRSLLAWTGLGESIRSASESPDLSPGRGSIVTTTTAPTGQSRQPTTASWATS